jgi:hypothetical protein
MPCALLYVSRSLLPASLDNEQLIDIQAVSLARNSQLDLTGVLIATPVFFTQYLEGAAPALAAVMGSIRADPRHTEIAEMQPAPRAAARFPAWRMACFPPGSFTSRHLEPILARHHGALAPADADALLAFMTDLTTGFPYAPPTF